MLRILILFIVVVFQAPLSYPLTARTTFLGAPRLLPSSSSGAASGSGVGGGGGVGGGVIGEGGGAGGGARRFQSLSMFWNLKKVLHTLCYERYYLHITQHAWDDQQWKQ